jgi:probable rRNA maturation factor
MPHPEIYISCDNNDWEKQIPDYEEMCRQAILACICACDDDVSSYDNSEVSILLTDDDHIQELNKEYRNIDKPTNVLSFAAEDADDDFPQTNDGDEPVILGDIIVALETVSKEAEEQNKTISDHFFHMIVHSMLHLLGYDHINDNDADEMENLETEILASFDIPNPYAN